MKKSVKTKCGRVFGSMGIFIQGDFNCYNHFGVQFGENILMYYDMIFAQVPQESCITMFNSSTIRNRKNVEAVQMSISGRINF